MKPRPKLAVWKFASCDGCQLSLLDCEDELLAVAGEVEIATFVEASRAVIKGPYDLSLVEGSITTPHDAERIQQIRRVSKYLVTIGACATAGGIQALRNFKNVKEFIAMVYATPAYIETLETSTPIADHVFVDFELQGCPINKYQLLEVISAFLHGRKPNTPSHSVCVECKRRGTVCVMVAHGTPCLGPVTHAGCGALCPAYHRGCYGCFGPKETPNTMSLSKRFDQLGVSQSEPVPLQSREDNACLPHGLRPLGAISLRDTLRPEARETLAQFATLGVQIKIISGDHPQTVAALAKQVGLSGEIKAMGGSELDALDNAQLAQRAEDTTVFGRITPQQKERLIQALRSRNHYVAMIGDGVNDLLSLKQANVGIAMQSGSQATRGVADLVLLHDTFTSLPLAMREGQRIRNGMQDILKLFLARVGFVTLLLISITFVGGFPFQPRQTSLLTFFTVGVPTLALAYWARSERVPGKSLIRTLAHFVLPVSMTTCLVALGIYLAVLVPASLRLPVPTNPYREGALPLAQTAITVFIVLCGLLLVLFVEPPNRPGPGEKRRYGNWRPSLLVLGLFGCFIGVLTLPSLRLLFNLQALDLVTYLVISGATLLWIFLIRSIWHFHVFERFFSFRHIWVRLLSAIGRHVRRLPA